MAWCQKHGIMGRRTDEDMDESGNSSLLAYHATPLRDTSTEDLRPTPVNAKKNLKF